MRTKWIKLWALLTVTVLSGVHIKAMADQASAESRKLSVLSVAGEEAFIIKGSARELPAAEGMPLGQGSKARTGYKTNLYLLADQDKTIKMDSSTQVEITKASSKKLKLTLKSGEIFFNVENPLGQDEEMVFEAAQTSMSIRGTSGVISTDGNKVSVKLFSGSMAVSQGQGTERREVEVKAGQGADLSPDVSNPRAEDFNWRELNGFELEAAAQQARDKDLSAIGLDRSQGLGEAEQALPGLMEEKARQEEEKQAAKQLESSQTGGENGPSRLDGAPPEDEDDDEDDGGYQPSTEAAETTVPENPTEPETTEPETTEPETTEPETTEPMPTSPDSAYAERLGA